MSDLIHIGTAYDICDGGRGEGGGEGGGSNTSHAKGQNPVQYQFTFTPHSPTMAVHLRCQPCGCTARIECHHRHASSIVGTGAHHSDDTPDEAT